jgi:hypothetical protein
MKTKLAVWCLGWKIRYKILKFHVGTGLSFGQAWQTGGLSRGADDLIAEYADDPAVLVF